ncbi:hypothetical protein C7271_01405 [filamentous cyanobacterium CCP5]|nr:hypothetical protein C7271_01405 [filamentous cyanobacterium CCP5]
MEHHTLPNHGFSNGSGQAWLQNSVRNFFEQLMWDGRPPLQFSSSEAKDSHNISPMTIAVKDFFTAIPWDGQPTIAAPLSPLEFQSAKTPPVDNSATLDDFFDSF